jgi:hypothetical protein
LCGYTPGASAADREAFLKDQEAKEMAASEARKKLDAAVVGLYKLNFVDNPELESAWFIQPLNLKFISWFTNFSFFKFNLHRYTSAAAAVRAALAAQTVARVAVAAPPLNEEQRAAWLSRRPFQPIGRAPYALSRFPTHDEELFDASEEAVVGYLEEQMQDQLVEFGIGEDVRELDDVRYVELMAAMRKTRVGLVTPGCQIGYMEHADANMLAVVN